MRWGGARRQQTEGEELEEQLVVVVVVVVLVALGQVVQVVGGKQRNVSELGVEVETLAGWTQTNRA